MKEKIISVQAPSPIGPYSQAVSTGGLVFVSGQIPINPATGRMVEGGIECETVQAISNLSNVLKSAGLTLDNVIKVEIYLKDISDFDLVNKIYEANFNFEVNPARVVVEVSRLPKDSLIEISCIAAK